MGQRGPGLFLHTGNRLETLADELSRVLEFPLESPMVPETIVVQSRGMQRWISMEIARRQGIFANGVFPFPNAFVDALCRCVVADLPDRQEDRFHPATLAFRLFSLLPECIEQAGFESIRIYLRDDGRKLKRLQLAEKIADLFDQYLVFRPEMILGWEQGTDTHWQAQLWRKLATAEGAEKQQTLHRTRLRRLLIEALGDLHETIPGLPERVSVFGVSYLPRFHLEVLSALARRIPVHLFCINPCREYWADIAGRREAGRIARRYLQAAVDPKADLHLEEGNRLLAATGTLGKAFLELILNAGAQIQEHFEEPGKDLLLSRVQSDILHLRNPDGAVRCRTDGSIQIHCCHNPMREIEVLHDQLLELFEEDPGLCPRDVLVMTPDIEAYAPLIHAVFDAHPDDRSRIPYSVSDSSFRRDSRVSAGLLAILDLAGSRLGASEVINLLEVEPIRRRFSLSEEEVGRISQWVAGSGIRWGRDAGDRKRAGLPATAANTWQTGTDRLLLGYAVPGEELLLHGIVPYGRIEGNDAQTLGRFLEFTHRLFDFIDRFSVEQPPALWKDLLVEALEALFLRGDESEAEYREILSCLDDLARHGQNAGCKEPIGWEAIRSWLCRVLESRSFGSGFISGGVTFCAMVPMRSIPFEVICMIGMNDGDFPRESRAPGFDLIAAHPRPGDRNRRDDDRYLFLEALISARRRLYISYVGQSVQDGSSLPPSVMVSELLDALHRGYGIEPEQLTVRHRLQAFSPRYFTSEDKLFSYSTENLKAAEALREEKSPCPFLTGDVPMTEYESKRWRALDVHTLCDFFSHPARFLLQQRLGVHLETEPESLEDTEPFVLEGLQAYHIGQELVQLLIKGGSASARMPVERGIGRLPHGTPGEAGFRRLSVDAGQFAQNVRKLELGEGLPPLEVFLDIDGFSLRGMLKDVYRLGLYRFRYGRMRTVDLFDGWIRHLVLCLLQPCPEPAATSLYFRDAAWRFSRTDRARRVLADLLGLFEAGLRRPLHLFPDTSEAYARAKFSGASENKAMARARRVWTDEYRPGESDEPYHRLCFRDRDPLDAEFRELAETVWIPLFESGEPISW